MRKNIALVKRARDILGPDGEIMLDCWMAFTERYTLEFAAMLEPYRVYWMEECLQPDDYAGFGRLNAKKAVELAMPTQPEYTAVHRAIQAVEIKDLKTSKLAVAVGDTKSLKDIRVSVDIEHTWIGDLVARIKPPAGSGVSTITLHDKAGGSAHNIKKTFDVTSTPALAALVGVVPEGEWTLEIQDTQQQDTGNIRAFAVEMDF